MDYLEGEAPKIIHQIIFGRIEFEALSFKGGALLNLKQHQK
jgi:hypothetical protein